jgi:sugar phosphate isomerase/epimerase
MNPSYELSRRSLLQGAAGLMLASAAQARRQSSAPSAETKPWVVACRDRHLKVTGKPDSWSAAKEIGAAGIEVEVDISLVCPGLYAPNETYSVATNFSIAALKDKFAEQGLVISAFLMHNQFVRRHDAELEWTHKLVEIADAMGVKAIRIDIGSQQPKGEDLQAFAARLCKQLCTFADGTSVRYGVENHGRVTNDPEFLEKLFDAVDSPHLGLTLDTANFYWYGHPLDKLYTIYERFATKVVHTHCKNIHYPADKRNVRRPIGWEYGKYNCPIYEGDIDFRRVTGILRHAGYRGDLCIEDESLGKFPEAEQGQVLKKEIAMLKKLAAAG